MEEPNEWGPSLLETLISIWNSGAPGIHPLQVGSHMRSQWCWAQCHQLTQRDRKRQPGGTCISCKIAPEQVVYYLAQKVSLQWRPKGRHCLPLGRGKNCVFILWLLTRVTETISFFRLAARKPRGQSVAHLSPMDWLVYILLYLLLTSFHM